VGGTSTGSDGAFSIKAGPNDKISVSYVGYTSIVVDVNNRTYIEIKMEPILKELGQIVLVGFFSHLFIVF